jgi:hypothetical protein
MPKFIYKVDRKTGKEYREYLGGKIVEVEPHDGHMDEDELIERLKQVLIHKIKTDNKFHFKIKKDARKSFNHYNRCCYLENLNIKLWKTTPTLKKANYKWWKLWLLSLRFRKNKEIKEALHQLKNNFMSPKKSLEWIEVLNVNFIEPLMPPMEGTELLKWAAKNER